MKVRDFFQWLHQQILDYNLFIPDEDEYDDGDNEPIEPATAVKYQRYATRFYVPLLIIILYILVFLTLTNPQNRTVTISNITPSLFNQLRLEYGETLSCPCSTITVPYKTFVSNTVSFHPICSSVFVSTEWIEALYLPLASSFFVTDFRTTASSQFELLAALCLLSKTTVSQALADLNSNQLVTIELLTEDAVRSQIYASVQLTKSNMLTQITTPLNFLQITTRSNFLVSALQTNLVVYFNMLQYFFSGPAFYVGPTCYRGNENITILIGYPSAHSNLQSLTCNLISSVAPAGFFLLKPDASQNSNEVWPPYSSSGTILDSVMIDGFFGGCTPLDAVLVSTFDCLYNSSCLEIFADYFPALNQINVNWTEPLSPSSQQNLSLNDILTNLFVEEWSTNISYQEYFTECAPAFCTYTETDQTKLSYTITLLLSIYGGLTIMLRLVATFLFNVSAKIKRRLINTNSDIVHYGTFIWQFARWTKELNMFKSSKNRTVSDIKQQRITTRVYLVLLAGNKTTQKRTFRGKSVE